ncbi:MAG: hypothetical protein WCB49_04750, partial [Gammaproteobacteria bacterium]
CKQVDPAVRATQIHEPGFSGNENLFIHKTVQTGKQDLEIRGSSETQRTHVPHFSLVEKLRNGF